MGTRRQFSREFKFEAVRLVKELEGRWRKPRGISMCADRSAQMDT